MSASEIVLRVFMFVATGACLGMQVGILALRGPNPAMLWVVLFSSVSIVCNTLGILEKLELISE